MLKRLRASWQLVAVLFLTACGPKAAPEDAVYTSTPILRVSEVQHTANIFRSGLSADGSTLVTASRDDTIKIWNVRGGRLSLVDTLRVPISRDYAGDPGAAFLRAIDISPDGRLIAAGGQVRADRTSRVFVIDTKSREIVATPLLGKGFIADIAFSPDGKMLAAGIYGVDGPKGYPQNGLWVWDTKDWSIVFRDPGYGRGDKGRINGLAFNRAGVLVSASQDGYLRRYENLPTATGPTVKRSVAQIADSLRASGRDLDPDVEPYELAFSPDGSQVAVSYLNKEDGDRAGALVLHDARDLAPVRSMDVTGLSDGKGGHVFATRVRGVGFSNSGRYVFANISAHVVGKSDEQVRRWSLQEPEARPRDIQTCVDQTVLGVLPYGKDGVILVDSDPCISIYDDNLKLTDDPRMGARYRVSPDQLDAKGVAARFLVSKRGDQFYLEGKTPNTGVMFDLRTRTLKPLPDLGAVAQLAEFDGYREAAGDMRFSEWANTDHPKLNDKPVDIKRGDQQINYAYSVDVAANGAFGILGNLYDIRRYNAAGKVLWTRQTPELALRTNVTPDANAVVAFFQDSVVRWLDPETGDILLSLWIGPKGDSWILWTPEGFYDSSGDAEDMIGWHLNNGPMRLAAWEGASRYRQFRRPDVIDEAVQQLIDGRRARGNFADLARAALGGESIREQAKPVTKITQTNLRREAGGARMNLTFVAQSPSGRPITGWRVDVDGRRRDEGWIGIAAGRPVKASVPIYAGEKYVTVRARTRDGWGHVAYASLAGFAAQPGQGPATSRRPPVLYALVVGVNQYPTTPLIPGRLYYAEADANSVVEFLKTQKRSTLFSDVRIRRVVGPAATLRRLNKELSWLKRSVSADDVILIYLAGHGLQDPKGRYYFVPSGASFKDYSDIDNQAVRGTDLAEVIQDSPAQAILFLDSCRSQGAVQRGMIGQVRSLEKDVFIYASSAGNQLSYEYSKYRHGAFTQALLEVAKGDDIAIARDGVVKSFELGDYLERRVSEITENSQTPRYFGMRPDGSIANGPLFAVAR